MSVTNSIQSFFKLGFLTVACSVLPINAEAQFGPEQVVVESTPQYRIEGEAECANASLTYYETRFEEHKSRFNNGHVDQRVLTILKRFIPAAAAQASAMQQTVTVSDCGTRLSGTASDLLANKLPLLGDKSAALVSFTYWACRETLPASFYSYIVNESSKIQRANGEIAYGDKTDHSFSALSALMGYYHDTFERYQNYSDRYLEIFQCMDKGLTYFNRFVSAAGPDFAESASPKSLTRVARPSAPTRSGTREAVESTRR